MDIIEFKNKTRGRWLDIFQSLGVEIRSDGRHQGCPICGPGNNSHRFRMDDKDGSGSWICTQCGAGDGIKLIQKHIGCSFPEAIEKIQEIVGGCKVEKVAQKQTYDVKKMLNKLWTDSVPLTGSDPASKYLHSRGLNLTPNNVRYCEKCYESDTKSDLMAMVARVQNSKGQPISLHRTYLGETGKADIPSPKKLMPGTESLNGGAIRLFMPGGMFSEDILGLGEGLESCISATQLFGVATWSCISSTILESFEPPENIREFVIFADADSSFAGQKSAYILANKLYRLDRIVSVEMPDKVGTDFNDVLRVVCKNLNDY